MPQRPPAVEARYPLRSRLNRFLCLDSSAAERRTHIPEVDGSNPSRGTREREKLICQYHMLRHAKVKPYCNIYLVRHSHQIQTRTANFRIFSLHSEKTQVSSFAYLPCVEKVPRDARQTLCVFCPLMHSYSSGLRGGAATSAYIVGSNPTECSIDFLKNL